MVTLLVEANVTSLVEPSDGVGLVLTGENDRPSTGRVEPVRGCLNNPSRLVWTTLTSLTAPLAALRSRKETKEKVDLS
jgi:hypothetical protein